MLVQVKYHPGIGIRELARLERVSVPGMSKFVARLEEAGLVERAPVAGDQRRGPPDRPRGSAPAGRHPRVPHGVPRRGRPGAAGAGPRSGPEGPEPIVRELALPLIAVLLVAAVLGVQVAAGGGDYVPRQPADPCTPRAVPPIPARMEPLAERIVLLGLDNAACRLGISRERPEGGPPRRGRPARPRRPAAQGLPASPRSARPVRPPRARQDDHPSDSRRHRRQHAPVRAAAAAGRRRARH